MTKLKIVFVLDRSGSMQTLRDEAIGGFNAYVEQMAKDSPDAVLSLILFDSGSIDITYDKVPIAEVKPLTIQSFVPRGMTPLYDAVGMAVTNLKEQKGKKKALIILTDGQENASQEHTKESIYKLLTEQQEKDKWLVSYLAANQDAFAEAAKFGVRADHTMSYSNETMRATFAVAGASASRYAKGDLSSAAFTAEERNKVK
jgi:Mg-chelatase subunit ChlD